MPEEEKQLDVTLRSVPVDFKNTVFLAAAVILFIVGFLAVLTNGCLLLTIAKDPLRCFRNKTAVLVGCLSVTDFITGAVTSVYVGVFHVRLILGSPPFMVKGVILTKLVSQFTVWSSMYIITVFSCERLIAIALPFFYRSNVSTVKMFSVCALIWVGCFFGNFLEVSGLREATYNTIELYVFFVAPLVVVFFAYCGIYYKLVRQRKITQSLTNSTEEQRIQQRHNRRERQLTITSFCILVGFVLSYCPWYAFYWVGTTCPSCLATRWYLACYHLSIPFLYMNSVFNPLLYMWRIPVYCRSIKAVFRGVPVDALAGSTNSAHSGNNITSQIRANPKVRPRQ
ncbi:melanocyte-stimulating hormone receptor [Nematostella vectensis]|uniref:melanocyte-stimulating hormone receptor n=1 Tax=Nematostella vectensis TaxID=45351 RepID=UPI0020770615|nr:melanocyte-stimulating hormone receptor [Nematostella vectensis]